MKSLSSPHLLGGRVLNINTKGFMYKIKLTRSVRIVEGRRQFVVAVHEYFNEKNKLVFYGPESEPRNKAFLRNLHFYLDTNGYKKKEEDNITTYEKE